MPTFSIFEIALIALAAIVLALEQGLVDAPRVAAHLPRWLKSAKWRYAPAVLIVVAAGAFVWRTFVAPMSPHAPEVPMKPQVIVRTVTAPDPKQATEITQLRAKIDELQHKLERKPVGRKELPHHVAQTARTSDDKDLLDSLRCERQRTEKKDELSELVRGAVIIQAFTGEKESISATEYSTWIAEVHAYFKTHTYAMFDISQFDGVHGNEYMKTPAYEDVQSVSLWREVEAKKSVLKDLLSQQDDYRC